MPYADAHYFRDSQTHLVIESNLDERLLVIAFMGYSGQSLLSLEKFWQLRYSIANFSITWNLFQFQQISSAMLKKKLFDSLETW